MPSVPPYHRVFMILEPCYEELITEFYASLEFYDTYVTFQLGGELNWLTMPKFRVALGLWMQRNKLQTSTLRRFQIF